MDRRLICYQMLLSKFMKATEEYNPALINCVIKFLKDNRVECMSEEGTPLNDLKIEALPFLEDPEVQRQIGK
jgi:hypothetical protein